MTEFGQRQGRVRDAQRAREAILDAAEVVFAQHGFDGARIDAIVKASGYNTSLLFQYFRDKLGLYAEVIKRADREMTTLLQRAFAPLLEKDTIAENADAFKTLLETIVATLFDYLVEHPRFMHMLLWEQAASWQTYSQIVSQFATADGDQFELLFRKAYNAGQLRSDFVPLIQLSMILQICLSYLTFVPLYQMVLPQDNISSIESRARARHYLIHFVVAGMMTDSSTMKPEKGS